MIEGRGEATLDLVIVFLYLCVFAYKRNSIAAVSLACASILALVAELLSREGVGAEWLALSVAVSCCWWAIAASSLCGAAYVALAVWCMAFFQVIFSMDSFYYGAAATGLNHGYVGVTAILHVVILLATLRNGNLIHTGTSSRDCIDGAEL